MVNRAEALSISRTRMNQADPERKNSHSWSRIWYWHHIIHQKCIYTSTVGDSVIMCLLQWFKRVSFVIRVQLGTPTDLATMAQLKARATRKHREEGTLEIVPLWYSTPLSCQVDVLNDYKQKAFPGSVTIFFFFYTDYLAEFCTNWSCLCIYWNVHTTQYYNSHWTIIGPIFRINICCGL